MSQTATALAPQKRVNTNYMAQIAGFITHRKVAEGGCAEIFEATNIDTKERVAIKLLAHRHLTNKTEQKRLLNEGALGMRLRHCDYIVRACKVGLIGERPYIIFEYIDGRTLREVIREEKMLADRETLLIALALGKAIRHIHEAGLLHKDIKPDNIMLDRAGGIKLIDFGFAETTSSVRFSFFGRNLEGSPAYMAPEFIRTKKPSPATDVYAIGCTLYEALTCRVPYPGDSDHQLLENQTNMGLKAPPITQFNAKVSPHTQRMVMMAIEKDPAKRHKSADELLLDLARNPLVKDGLVNPRGSDRGIKPPLRTQSLEE